LEDERETARWLINGVQKNRNLQQRIKRFLTGKTRLIEYVRQEMLKLDSPTLSGLMELLELEGL
jgi:hypothetical protein